MDGVIIDSTAAHAEAWRVYLSRHGIGMDDIAARMLGKHNDEIVRDFFGGRELSRVEILDHGANKERLYRDMISAVFDRQLVPGIAEFLASHSETPAGLATNAESANVDFVLDRAGIRKYFGAIVSGGEVERPKPAPDIYLKAASLLDADPAECIVFEDSITGVDAAKVAGMRVVGLTTTINTFPGVDLAIRDFNEPRLELWLQQAGIFS